MGQINLYFVGIMTDLKTDLNLQMLRNLFVAIVHELLKPKKVWIHMNVYVKEILLKRKKVFNVIIAPNAFQLKRDSKHIVLKNTKLILINKFQEYG